MTDLRARDYEAEVIRRLWTYRNTAFRGDGYLFDSAQESPHRPPVFARGHVDLNVIVRREGSAEEWARVRGMIKTTTRHKWFGSMRSSQALAQSVFANLIVLCKLDALVGLQADDGGEAFFAGRETARSVFLEHPVRHLGEPRSTEVDVFFDGPSRVAVECKIAERKVGPCSRPALQREDPMYCDGTYTRQQGRAERCSLTVAGVQYWDHVPRLFSWSREHDHSPCPLHATYQLVRNVLAACVREDGSLDTTLGHALLLYDARNPAFRPGGAGFVAYGATRAALFAPSILRRCSWQRLLGWLGREEGLSWLVDEVGAKYGLTRDQVPV